MSDGFLDFSMDEGDDRIGKRSKRFSGETGRTYRATFAWFSTKTADGWDDEAAWNEDGSLSENAVIRYSGAERIYKPGVGYIIYDGPAYAQFGQAKMCVATIVLVWPTDKDGELDVGSFKAGKGWQIQPWTFSTDKYNTIKKSNKRFSLLAHDLSINCTDAQYQKMTFTPESENLLQKIMNSDKPEYQALVQKIRSEVAAVAGSIRNDIGRTLTVDQVKEAMGEDVSSPAPSHAAKDVDDLLNDLV